MMRNLYYWLLVGALLLAGCGKAAPVVTPLITPSRPISLLTYQTPTLTLTPALINPSTAIPLTPAPTATPFTHAVVQGDTMLGIAIRYGVKLEDLMAANPTINPRILSIGTLLVIPLQPIDASPAPSETPFPLQLQMPVCYPDASQGVWCATYVTNNQETDLENVSAWIGLYAGEQVFVSQTIVPLLNKIGMGVRAPLLAYFAGPIPQDYKPHIEILTALTLQADDPRYQEIELLDVQVETAKDGKTARVTGQVRWAADQAAPGVVWVVAVAEDALGRPVGVRKWDTRPSCTGSTGDEQPPAGAGQCQALEVNMTVFSLGPQITTVKLLAEARP